MVNCEVYVDGIGSRLVKVLCRRTRNRGVYLDQLRIVGKYKLCKDWMVNVSRMFENDSSR
jgi:hypothetical protein